jgi:hypothetical protein
MEKEVGRKPAFTHDLAHGTKNHAHHKECVMCLFVGALNAAHSYRYIFSVVRPRSNLGVR